MITRHLIHTFIYLHRDKNRFILDFHDRYALSVATLVHKNSAAINVNQISNLTMERTVILSLKMHKSQ